ncbi:MAG: glutathione peroxidase [Hydrogenophaga sp.]
MLGGLGLLIAVVGSPASARTPATPAAAADAAAARCPALLQHRLDRLQDEKPQDLCQYAGRVVLVVNTASFCGYTGQYKGLEALYARYQAQGLVVLGFPSNDFGRQEPGSNQAIADFCENTFGVRFPMFSKSTVVGPEAHPLFQQLTQRSGQAPRWNFHKYLIDRTGQTVRSYPSTVEPLNPTLTRDIERFLSTRS